MPPLALVRRLKGFSIRALADATGLAPSAIFDIERGATKRPRPSTIARVADALGVDPATINEFVNGDGSGTDR